MSVLCSEVFPVSILCVVECVSEQEQNGKWLHQVSLFHAQTLSCCFPVSSITLPGGLVLVL